MAPGRHDLRTETRMSPEPHLSPQNMAVYNVLRVREIEQRPIRVGIIGAGATGRAIALQLGTPVPGIRLPGIGEWAAANTPGQAEERISHGIPVLTDDPGVLTACNAVDIIVEVTGTVDF